METEVSPILRQNIDAGQITTGTLGVGRIPSAITRDTELAAHAALLTGTHGAGGSTLATAATLAAAILTHKNLATAHHTPPTLTKEFSVPVTYGSDAIALSGSRPVAALTGNGDYAAFSFDVPADFAAITTAVIVVRPTSTQGAANWDIYSDYATPGEAYQLHQESDEATTYNVTADELFAVDVSGILSALAPGDNVGVAIKLANAAHDLEVISLHIKYS